MQQGEAGPGALQARSHMRARGRPSDQHSASMSVHGPESGPGCSGGLCARRRAQVAVPQLGLLGCASEVRVCLGLAYPPHAIWWWAQVVAPLVDVADALRRDGYFLVQVRPRRLPARCAPGAHACRRCSCEAGRACMPVLLCGAGRACMPAPLSR